MQCQWVCVGGYWNVMDVELLEKSVFVAALGDSRAVNYSVSAREGTFNDWPILNRIVLLEFLVNSLEALVIVVDLLWLSLIGIIELVSNDLKKGY